MFRQIPNSDAANKEDLLWQKLLEGRRKALDDLFRLYYGPLLNYGIKLVADRELVKDAIQKLFLKLWNKRQSLSRPRSIKSYLYVSMRRILLGKVEKRKSRKRRNKSYLESKPSVSFAVEEAIVAGEHQIEQRKVLAKAVAKLSPRQKEALYLRFYDGLTNKEVADVMDIAHQSVRNHISEAIQKLKFYIPDSLSFSNEQNIKAQKVAESL